MASSLGRRGNPAVRESLGVRGGVRCAACRCSRAMASLPARRGSLLEDRWGATGEARRAAICAEDRASHAGSYVDNRASRAENPMVAVCALVRPSRAGCGAGRPNREGRSVLRHSRPARPHMSSLRPPLSCASSSCSRSVPSRLGLEHVDCRCIAAASWGRRTTIWELVAVCGVGQWQGGERSTRLLSQRCRGQYGGSA